MRSDTKLFLVLLIILAVGVFLVAPSHHAKAQPIRSRHIAFRHAPVVAEAVTYPVRALKVLATSYCNRGPTFTGVPAGPGSIAVDPRVVPLGSSLYVPGYGYGTADDTGSGIKGDRIDVWLPSCAESIDWGAKTLAVDVLGRRTIRLATRNPS